MKLKAIIEGEEHEIELSGESGRIEVRINGELRVYDVSEPEPGVYSFKTSKGAILEAYVADQTDDGTPVTVVDREFEIAVFDPRRMGRSDSGTGSTDGAVKIKAAMPGKVVSVIAGVGDEVAAGEGVLVVEAMKMQNELKSPKDGIVKEIRVAEDDRVNSGDVLLIIE